MSISWTAQSDFLHPIERFIGNITIEPSGDKRQRRQDNRAEIRTFNVENSTYKYKLKDFATDKIYTVVICAVNEIGENCSDPWGPTFFPPPTGPLPPSGTSISPGVIAGIVVAVVALILLCCLFLLLLLLLCCKKDSEKAYYPGIAIMITLHSCHAYGYKVDYQITSMPCHISSILALYLQLEQRESKN